MSYCRFMSGDVYLYPDVGGYICCCACRLAPKTNGVHDDMRFWKYSEALAHMEGHRSAGHSFPEYAVERLREEQAEYGDALDTGSDGER